MTSRGWVLLLAVVLVGIAAGAQAQPQIGGKRVALVIGNGAYRNVDLLENATNDAKLIAATLRKLNFTLVGGGAQLARMAASVEQFGHLLSGADVGLFYYSGHGLQVSGVNWLVPVDANPTRAKDLDFQMVDADLVLRQVDAAGTRLNLVLLDACRNNPFSVGGLHAVQGRLAEMRAPDGTLIAYATQPGNVALDGEGKDSPYTTALAKMMQTPGPDIFRLFNQVGLEVKRVTSGSQQPWVSNSPIDGDFYFAGQPPAIGAPLPAAPPVVAAAPPGVVAAPAPPPQPQSPPMQVAGLVRPLDLPAPSAPQAGTSDALLAVIRARPCSILDARQVGDHIDVHGLAARGSNWNGFLHQVGATSGLHAEALDVDFLPPFACEPVAVLAAVVRATRDAGAPPLLRLGQREVADTEALAVTLQGAAGKTVVLDMFRAGDVVDHMRARPVPSGGGDLRMFIKPATDAPPDRAC